MLAILIQEVTCEVTWAVTWAAGSLGRIDLTERAQGRGAAAPDARLLLTRSSLLSKGGGLPEERGRAVSANQPLTPSHSRSHPQHRDHTALGPELLVSELQRVSCFKC